MPGLKGEPGEAALPGLKGDSGDHGLPGLPGDKGTSGGVSALFVNHNNYVVINSCDLIWGNVCVVDTMIFDR